LQKLQKSILEKKKVSSTNSVGKTKYPQVEDLNYAPNSYSIKKFTQNRSRPKCQPETVKFLEQNIGKTLEDIGICNTFLNRTLVALELKTRIDK
jgi:hypothetical protein